MKKQINSKKSSNIDNFVINSSNFAEYCSIEQNDLKRTS